MKRAPVGVAGSAQAWGRMRAHDNANNWTIPRPKAREAPGREHAAPQINYAKEKKTEETPIWASQSQSAECKTGAIPSRANPGQPAVSVRHSRLLHGAHGHGSTTVGGHDLLLAARVRLFFQPVSSGQPIVGAPLELKEIRIPFISGTEARSRLSVMGPLDRHKGLPGHSISRPRAHVQMCSDTFSDPASKHSPAA